MFNTKSILVPKMLSAVVASSKTDGEIGSKTKPKRFRPAAMTVMVSVKQKKNEEAGGEEETSNNTQGVQDAGSRAVQHDVESGSPHVKGAPLCAVVRQHEPPAPVSAVPTRSMVPTTPASSASVRQPICDTPGTKVSAGLGAVEQAKETYKNKLLQNKSNKRQKAKAQPLGGEHMEREARVRVLEKSAAAIELELSDTDSQD